MNQEDLKKLIHYCPISGVFTHLKTHRGIKKGDEAGTVSSLSRHPKQYRRIGIGGKYYKAHRLAFLYMKGYIPDGPIDHINHDSLDNSWKNLRQVDHKTNGKNQKRYSNNSSGITGVRQRSAGKWRARIYNEGTHIDLGTFETKEEAVNARKKAEILYGFHENHGKSRDCSHRTSL